MKIKVYRFCKNVQTVGVSVTLVAATITYDFSADFK